MKRSIMLALAAAATLAAAPAIAGSCPVMSQAIGEALMSTELSSEQAAEVRGLRDQGDSQHAGGQHAEAVATLAKAKAILGIE